MARRQKSIALPQADIQSQKQAAERQQNVDP